MRYAIISDIHDNVAGLRRVLRDVERQNVDDLIFLGDAGYRDAPFSILGEQNARCLFGNWEVSGLRRLSAEYVAWVAEWSATLHIGDAICCHATPDMPPTVETTRDAARLMMQGASWHSLFPRLHLDEEAVWRAFAVLEEQGLRVAFHGHTHVQQVWAWQEEPKGSGDRRLRRLAPASELALEPGDGDAANRYIVGVGSAGQPQDGYALRYVCYDDQQQVVSLRALE